jgi:uncharacterized membrane protein YgcG
MSKFITSTLFLNFIVPLAAVVLSVFVKAVSRDDRQPMFKREDLSVGFELALASLLAFTTQSVSIAQRISAIQGADDAAKAAKQALEAKFTPVPWLLLVWVIGLWALSTLVRKLGWKSSSAGTQGNPNMEPTWFIGIVLPLIFGLVCLVIVVNWVEP